MFKSFGRGFFSLGLILGVAATLVFVGWIVGWFGEPPDTFECPIGTAAENCRQPEDFTGFRITSFIRVTPSDTIAQWAMALLALVATLISIWGVVLIRGTLVATNETLGAAREANQIILSADRPWITKDGHNSGTFEDSQIGNEFIKKGLVVVSRWTNTGKRPAINADLFASNKVIGINDSIPTFERFDLETMPERRNTGMVATGEKIGGAMQVLNDANAQLFRDRKIRWIVYSVVEYSDPVDPERRLSSQSCVEVINEGWEMIEGVNTLRFAFISVGAQNTYS